MNPYSYNKSGVGAVVFTPGVSPLDVHLKTVDNILRRNNEMAQEQAKEREQFNALLGELNVDTEGILDHDIPSIMEKKKELELFYANAIRQNINPDNPEFIDDYTNAVSKKNELVQLVEFSKQAKDRVKDAREAYMKDPTKANLRAMKENIANYVANTPIKDRAKSTDPLYAPKGIDVIQSILEDINDAPKQQGAKVSDSGRVLTTTTTKYINDSQLDSMAINRMQQDSEFRDEINSMYLALPEEKQIAWADESFAKAEAKEFISPQELYARQLYRDQRFTEVSKESKQSPGYAQGYAYRKEIGHAKALLEEASGLMNGDPTKFYNKGDRKLSNAMALPLGKATIKVPKAKTSSDETWDRATGEDAPITSSEPEYEDKVIDNSIIQWEYRDDGLYYRTTESTYNADLKNKRIFNQAQTFAGPAGAIDPFMKVTDMYGEAIFPFAIGEGKISLEALREAQLTYPAWDKRGNTDFEEIYYEGKPGYNDNTNNQKPKLKW